MKAHILLITHAGVPTEWPLEPGSSDKDSLIMSFEKARKMCQLELLEGGTLKLFDDRGELIREARGRSSSELLD